MAECDRRQDLVTPIPSYYITAIWPRVVDLLIPALKRFDSGYSVEDVLHALQGSDMQLWVAGEYEGAVVTQIIKFPQFKTCRVFAAGGGGMEVWMDEMEDRIETWARELGCKYLTGGGRRGWMRMGERRGWKTVGVEMSKEIANG